MRRMVRIGAVLFLLALLPARASAAPPDLAAIDEAARDAIASGEVPGAVIVVGQGDRVLYHRAFGRRRVVPYPVPMTEDTIFDIASLTKPLGTTLAVMALVERGRVRLDTPVGAYLREFRAPAFREVTIRRLLTHRAGLPAVPPDATVRVGFPRAARELSRLSLDYPPGAGFQYSDTGFILLGEMVRRVTGEPLDRYLRRIVFRPLGLADTTFRPGERLRRRIAPTEFANGHLLWGEVHDPRARLLGGVAGHAGMFSTARDLSRICRMLLAQGRFGSRRILRPATVRAMWTPSPTPDSPRALGWDVTSTYAQPMAPFFPSGSVGHTGFTGTAVWLDPPSRTYMILLTNRVHPNGSGARRIRELRTRVAAAVGAALFGRTGAPAVAVAASLHDDQAPPTGPAADPPLASVPRVLSGLDALERQNFAVLAGHTIGLVTNQSGLDLGRRRTIDVLFSAPGVRLQAIFSPEHGLSGDANTDVPHGQDAMTGLPVWSLYGPTRRPTPEMLRGLTTLVFDVQDVGVRYYTYLTTLLYLLEVAARQQIPVIVLDRPNPLTGRVVEGPLADPDLRSFTAPHPIPVRTGLTIGEFARLSVAERRIPVSLTVVALTGWERGLWFDETGLPWANPSPNIRSVTGALLYSGIGLLEPTNLSVGRGTDTPFEVVGAPWVEPHAFAQAMNRRGLAGARFEAVFFTPAQDIYTANQCGGVRIVVENRNAIRPVTVALALASELRARYREFRPELIQHLLVNRPTMWALLRSEPLPRLLAWSDAERENYLRRRAPFLIYR